MSRHRVLGLVLAALGLGHSARAQTATTTAVRPEQVVARALQVNPATAPYQITVTWDGRRIVLSGRVGSSVIHDAALQTVIGIGYPVRDDMVTDTATAYRTFSPSNSAPPMSMGTRPWIAAPGLYPPPLFGYADNPFYGFEPPILSYPPWWRNLSAARQSPVGMGASQPPAPVQAQADPDLAPGTLEMTMDSRGVAELRGTVPTLADRIAVGQKMAQTPGVTEVVNLLKVDPAVAVAAAAVPNPNPNPNSNPNPPPPPVPAHPAPPPAPPAADRPVRAERPLLLEGPTINAGGLTDRITQAFARKPGLSDLPIRVTVRDGVASLSGKAPTVYEAMLAYRAVQQTPGVRTVEDQLEFLVPDGEKANPLLQKGRPEDVEPYIVAQLQRQVGDLAHIDQVRLRGDVLEVRGTLLQADDRPRLDAILRSMPVLRGFRVEPTFVTD